MNIIKTSNKMMNIMNVIVVFAFFFFIFILSKKMSNNFTIVPYFEDSISIKEQDTNIEKNKKKDISLTEAEDFIKKYYSNLASENFKEAYEVSAKNVKFVKFKRWFKDIKSIEYIDVSNGSEKNKFVADLCIKWNSGVKKYYHTTYELKRKNGRIVINDYVVKTSKKPIHK